jgi:ActR/RegA family two-component response regulator
MPSKLPRILFVDDEPSIRTVLPPVLQQHGFEVRVAATVPEALVEINSYDFDVLISDLNIEKQGDGFLVVSAMRHLQPECVNLILTGYPALETAVQAIHDQVDDYLVKPADIDLLLKTIGDKLESKHRRPTPLKKLSALLRENAADIQRQVLDELRNTRGTKARLSDEDRLNRLPVLFSGVVDYLDRQSEALDGNLLGTAAEHGKLRRRQGWTASLVCNDYQMIQRAVYGLVRSNLNAMSVSGIIADLERFHMAVNSLMSKSVQAFEGTPKRSIS